MSLTEKLSSGEITPDAVIELVDQKYTINQRQYTQFNPTIEKQVNGDRLLTILKEPIQTETGYSVQVTILKIEDIPDTIGERIKKARVDANITFENMCNKLRTTSVVYGDYENTDWYSIDDFDTFSMDMFLDIAGILNCSLDYLIKGVNSFRKDH